MCLDTVKEKTTPETLIQSGWKLFEGTQSAPRFAAYNYKGSRDVPLDKWIKAETSTVKTGSGWKSYESGFHIFEDELQKFPAWSGSKRRVYFRKVTTRGEQGSCTTVIAEEMYVPSNPDGWPPR